MTRVCEKKYSIKQAAVAIGISPSGVRLLLNTQKLGYYQPGTRRIIGESHLDAYLSTIERNKPLEVRQKRVEVLPAVPS